LQEQVNRRGTQFALRIAFSSRAIYGATEVAMTIYPRDVIVPLGGHVHQSAVAGTLRVKEGHGKTSHPSTLYELALGLQVLLPHSLEDTTSSRLEAIVKVRDGSSVEDRHRVGEVVVLYLGDDTYWG
jgi:hypothetical protein